MNRYHTAEEARLRAIEAMGDELGSVYSALWQQTALIYVKLSQYLGLFASSKQNIELLNRAGGNTFGIIQDALWDDILIHLARLTDPAASGKHRNLTIQLLPLLVTQSNSIELTQIVNDAVKAARFCRLWRDKGIAHADLDSALGRLAVPVTRGSQKEVKFALSQLVRVINSLAEKYLDTSNTFEFILSSNTPTKLLRVIERGLEKP